MKTRNEHGIFSGIVVGIDEMEVEIGDKGWHRYQVVRHPGGVAVLPFLDAETVLLVRQLRPAIGVWTLELPAGRLDVGEEPQACALRELREETGLVPGRLESLGVIHSTPGFCDERIHLYAARDVTRGVAAPEAYEDLQPVELPLAEAVEKAVSGEISDGKTIAALFRAWSRR